MFEAVLRFINQQFCLEQQLLLQFGAALQLFGAATSVPPRNANVKYAMGRTTSVQKKFQRQMIDTAAGV